MPRIRNDWCGKLHGNQEAILEPPRETWMFVFTRVVGLHEAKRSVVDGDGEQAEVVCVADPWWTNGVLQEVRDEELHD